MTAYLVISDFINGLGFAENYRFTAKRDCSKCMHIKTFVNISLVDINYRTTSITVLIMQAVNSSF